MRCAREAKLLPPLLFVLSLAAAGACSRADDGSSVVAAGQRPAEAPAQSAKALHFAVLGDTGTGEAPQYRVGERLAEARQTVPFDFVLLLGDNLYDVEKRPPTSADYQLRFERPYAKLLSAGVKFYASLGNHDRIEQTKYRQFNMGGRYYTFKPGGSSVRFFALDSNNMDAEQMTWLEKELKGSGSDWKISFFHHPIYSSGMEYGPDLALRARLEPLFTKYGVDVVLSGHEHFYERIKPQGGVHYFISGHGGKLRRGNIRRTTITDAGYDRGRGFMLVSVEGQQLRFQARDEQGRVVDQGAITRARRE
jgi:hypothetical protein